MRGYELCYGWGPEVRGENNQHVLGLPTTRLGPELCAAKRRGVVLKNFLPSYTGVNCTPDVATLGGVPVKPTVVTGEC